MNNRTIAKELISAFLATSAITLLLGLVGYYGILKSNEAITEIGTVRLPGVQSLLIISANGERIKVAQRTLMNPNLNQTDRASHRLSPKRDRSTKPLGRIIKACRERPKKMRFGRNSYRPGGIGEATMKRSSS